MRERLRGVQARVQNGLARRQRLQLLVTQAHRRLFLATGGRFVPSLDGAPVVVLETVGRRTGEPRSTPVIHVRDGDAYVVTGANAGNDRVPAWWLNLRAAGRAHVDDGGRRIAVRARFPEGAERERLARRFAERYPMLHDYRRFTERELPFAVLEPE